MVGIGIDINGHTKLPILSINRVQCTLRGKKKKVNFAMSISFANAQEDDNDRIEQSVLAVSCGSPS
jgi:hypothetical protein